MQGFDLNEASEILFHSTKCFASFYGKLRLKNPDRAGLEVCIIRAAEFYLGLTCSMNRLTSALAAAMIFSFNSSDVSPLT
jgi:hypothetical protein